MTRSKGDREDLQDYGKNGQRTTRQLLDLWEMTTANNDPNIPTVRGWLMDELASRFPEAFDKWLDSDTDDAALREYVLG